MTELHQLVGVSPDLAGAAQEIVRMLLGEQSVTGFLLAEASVHRPTRSRIWVASFTGPQGGQIWRSTGLVDRDQALLVARKWEQEARAERAKLGLSPRKPAMRVRHTVPFPGSGPLSQREVALLLNISERAVKAIERRAIQKLRNHPVLREVWQQFLSGELDEYQSNLTPEETGALFALARTMEEQLILQKVLRMTAMRVQA